MDYGTYETMEYSSQASPEAAGAALAVFGVFMVVFFVIFIAIYIYMAICLMKMAKKTNTPNAWFAWIPFLNVWLMIQIAGREWWWFLLFFIPFVNIVASIMIWMGICKALGKPEWLGILVIVPIANFVVPGYLAFSKDEAVAVSPATPQA
jgi:hypothetical protein